jgi:hypothetical protein
VGLFEPAKDLQQDVAGQCRPVSLLLTICFHMHVHYSTTQIYDRGMNNLIIFRCFNFPEIFILCRHVCTLTRFPLDTVTPSSLS